jgi:hypothetical protein
VKWIARAWGEGRRKLIYGGAAFVAIVGYGFKSGASFDSFATAILAWLGIQLAGHVTAEKLGKAPPVEVK